MPESDSKSLLREERSDENLHPTFVASRLAHLSLQQQRAALPIAKYELPILYAVEQNDVVIVVGETGSGKSTQLPQFLYNAGYAEGGGMIAVCQPRRVAALSLCNRVSEELGCVVGREVGFAIRFEQVWGSNTKIKFLTDGILLNEMIGGSELAGYSALMIDEVHERSIETDLILANVKKLIRGGRKGKMKVIISSATMDAEVLKSYFESGDECE